MSIQDERKLACFKELLEELHTFEKPDEKYVPPGKLRAYSRMQSPSYDHGEVAVTCDVIETEFCCFVNSWKPGYTHVTIAIQDTRHPAKKGIAHFNMDEHSVQQVVFYAALHWQLREAERRTLGLRRFMSYISDMKTNRPEAHATLRKMDKSTESA